MTARIVRPDLHCTNGYVHVIDTVLMNDRDVSISAADKNMPIVVSLAATTLMLRFFI